jgi:hypothetical protein
VFERNAAKTGPEVARKNGILINSGGARCDLILITLASLHSSEANRADKLTAEVIAAKIKENKEQ